MKIALMMVFVNIFLLNAAYSDTPLAPVPLPVGAPMLYYAGNDVPWLPVVPPGEKQLTMQEAKAAIMHRAEVAHKAGLTSLESYVKWWICEPQPGKWDFSYYDLHEQAAKETGIHWLPLIIAGPAYGTPPWFKASKESIPSRCLEHGLDTAAQSIWNPALRPRVSEFLRRFAEHFDAGQLESVMMGISGDFGEALYTAGGNMWTYLDSPYHVHTGYWCGEDYARADFRIAMRIKYKTIEKLNSAWGTAYPGFEAVQPFLPEDAPGRRARLDFQRWYCASMTSFLEFWLQETRRTFPKSRIMVAAGGDGRSTCGGDFSAQAELAAKYNAGVQITNEASDYTENFMVTRQVTTACRFYGTYSSIEPAGGVLTEAIPSRVYNATASGADGLFTYDPEPEGDRAQYYSKLRKFLVKREPAIDVGLFLNRTSWDLGLLNRYWQEGRNLRAVTDFDIIDERLMIDGALGLKRVLFWLDGPVVEQQTAGILEKWVSKGGLLVVQGKGRYETVEGSPLSWLPNAVNGSQPVPDRYRIDVGNAEGETGLIGKWFDREAGMGFAAPDDTFRWSTDGSQIDLPVPGKKGMTVAVMVSASGPLISDQQIIVNDQTVARAQHPGVQMLSFYLTPAQIAGRSSIELTFGGPTWPSVLPDTRRLGMAVGSVMVGNGKVDPSKMLNAPISGYVNGLTLDRVTKPPYLRRLGRGAIVYLPMGDLKIEDVAREAVYNPGRFMPGKKAPYPMIKSDCTVYVTRFRDGSALFLNSGSTDAHISYAGHSMVIPPHSIASKPK
ncbi:MAG: beta-galactosidase [Armatimonadota bacterium]